MQKNIFVLVEKTNKRAIMIFESGLLPFIQNNFPVFHVKEVHSIGVSSFYTEKGMFTTNCISTEGGDYYLLKSWPCEMSLGEAYKYLLG